MMLETIDVRPQFMEIPRPDLADRYNNAEARCWTYEIWDTQQRLVYVGVADNWERRWTQHQAKSWWVGEVDIERIYLIGYRTREEALQSEAYTINTQSPVYNTRTESGAYKRAERDFLKDEEWCRPVGKRFFGIVWAE